VITNWHYHERSRSPAREASYIHMNSLSVAHGLSTSTEFKVFRKSHSGSLQKRDKTCFEGEKEHSIRFGLPLKPSTPMKAVMGNFYANITEQNIQSQKSFNWSQKTRETAKNPSFKNSTTEKRPASQPGTLFKLKRFQTAKAKVSCWRSNE
jgi:hypothetical protein